MSAVQGLRDEDRRIIESMSANAFAPMVLPVLFVLLPLIAAVLTGLSLNTAFPQQQPGQWGWAQLAIWYPLVTWYVIKKWKETARASWLNLTYWVGKRFWSNDFLVIDWRLLGKIENKTGVVTATQSQVNGKAPPPTAAPVHPDAQVPAGTELSVTIVPEALRTYKYVIEFLLRSEHFPKLWVCMNDLPERELSWVGNSSAVLNGGLLFQTDHIAAASFVRCDFLETEIDEFVPIGLFNSDALIAEEIYTAHKPELPTKDQVESAVIVGDRHNAGLMWRKWQDAEAIIKNWEKESDNLDKRVDDRVGARIEEAIKAGQIPIGPGAEGPKRKMKIPGTKLQWGVFLFTVAIIALVAWRLGV